MAAGWFSGPLRWLFGRWGTTAATTVVTPGGVARRPGPLSRLTRRPPPLSRGVERPGALSRATRSPSMSNQYIEYETWEKAAAEVRKRAFDWTKWPEIAAGDTIVSVSVPAVSGITATADASAPTADDYEGPVVGKFWYVTFSGGTANTSYLVKANATTSGGAVLPIWLLVKVR